MQVVGENCIIFPFELGGFQMIQALLRPEVMDFLDFALTIENEEIQLDQLKIRQYPLYIGKMIKEIGLHQNINVLVIFRGEEKLFNPKGDTVLEENDILVVLGRLEDLPRPM